MINATDLTFDLAFVLAIFLKNCKGISYFSSIVHDGQKKSFSLKSVKEAVMYPSGGVAELILFV